MSRHDTTWEFHPRWKIQAHLSTATPLHIGSGIAEEREDIVTRDGNQIEINTCIKDGADDAKPYIPGSTLKGNIRAWLNKRISGVAGQNLLREILGHADLNPDEQKGGRAEFLNAYIRRPIEDDDLPLPHWNRRRQTYIETSTVIDRVSRTVAHKKLFHTETVPPGVEFSLEVTGSMPEEQAAILIAAIHRGFVPDTNNPITIGADDVNGKGCLQRIEELCVHCMKEDDVSSWLAGDDERMAQDAMPRLSPERVNELIRTGSEHFHIDDTQLELGIDLQFSGPFLVNDPSRVTDDTPNHLPLCSHDNNPELPPKSFRGALRSQAERIIRTLGGKCCDPKSPCPTIYNVEEVEDKLCLACQVFGASGYQSRISISPFTYHAYHPEEIEQEFIAIDRFTDGGKDGAKFKTAYTLRPRYTGKLSLREIPSWGKGLLSLVFRDLQESDISFGYGAAKGYGKIENAVVTGMESLQDLSNIEAFRAICREQQQEVTCSSRPVPVAQQRSEECCAAESLDTGEDLFHNPYHFIPVQTPNTTTWLRKQADSETVDENLPEFNKQMHDSHAIYRNENSEGGTIYNGCIECRLVSETPIFIGGKNKGSQDGQPAEVEHYTLDEEPAIPAATLRGMISSLVESASNSSLRVLDNTLLSYRKPLDIQEEHLKALSAIGMVTERDGKLELIPLALPTMNGKRNNEFHLPANFQKMFPDGPAKLKVYLENASTAATSFSTWTPQNNTLYWLDCPSEIELQDNCVQVNRNDTAMMKIKTFSRNSTALLGAKTDPSFLNNTEQNGYVPGILRIFGKQDRVGDLPPSKKHEMFIPVPEEYVNVNHELDFEKLLSEALSYSIAPEAIEQFHELARQRTVSQKKKIEKGDLSSDMKILPYHLQGTRENRALDLEHAILTLQRGDIVFFRPDRNGNSVAELSFSSVWRGKVEERVFDFFPEELRPFNYSRQYISPAELMFGFVQDDKQLDVPDEKENDQALAFAGKVLISAGCLEEDQGDIQDGEVTLKILSSPKLPSPALYFKKKSEQFDDYIPKYRLDAFKAAPQGRKYYLHAMRQNQDHPESVQKIDRHGHSNDNGRYPWRSFPVFENGVEKNANQKVRIKPVKKGKSFTFHVEFNNLSEWELGLLCFALRPSESFRHKIGMGKPIGLGTIRIDITDMHFIDRYKRYNEDSLNTQRYNSTGTQITVEQASCTFKNTMNPDTRQAFRLLGDPLNITSPVHYPQQSNANIEEKSYSWFVNNDKGLGEYLKSKGKLNNAVEKYQRTQDVNDLNRMEQKKQELETKKNQVQYLAPITENTGNLLKLKRNN